MIHLPVLSLSTLVTIVTATIFTSSHKVREMALQEDKILSKLKDYIDQHNGQLGIPSDAYVILKQEALQRPATEVARDLHHPNGVYLAIKRFAFHYHNVLGTSYDLVKERLQLGDDPTKLADVKDLEGALHALIRLQEVYNLSTSDMIHGNYTGHVGPSLGYQDAYFVGRIAFTAGKLNTSRDWLERSLELRARDPITSAIQGRSHPVTVAAIKSLIGRGQVRLGNIGQAEGLHREASEDNPNNGDVDMLAKELKTQPLLEPSQLSDSQANYSRLCQYKGPYHLESPDYQAMKCRYKATLVPYYVFREEILSLSPYVSLFYNAFTDEDQAHLRESVYSTLSRGFIGSGRKKDVAFNADVRTSDVAWLRDEDSVRTAKMSQRISLMTGLSVSQPLTSPAVTSPQNSEDFQVVNYGVGGHYTPHLDPFMIPDSSGMRIATFLIYLGGVVEGGNTVFTRAGISVSPAKDTALFWYSFSPSFNQVDEMTRHAGCPVMVGQKWIANKWIRSHGNAYFRPCGLKPDYTQMDMEKVMYHQQQKLLNFK